MCLNESKGETYDVKHEKKSGEGNDLALHDLIKDEAFIPACAIKMWLGGTADLLLVFPAISCY